MTKSPLRYPGGKSRAVKHILPLIPPDRDIMSPFFGGGSVELALWDRGQLITGYDAFRPLVNFWKMLMVFPARDLADAAEKYLGMTREQFRDYQKQLMGVESELTQGAMFFALNRSSFDGTLLSGGMSPGTPRFNHRSIQRLRDFPDNWRLRVYEGDFRETIPLHDRCFIYADPPYVNNSKLYGDRGDLHKGFDHAALARLLHERGDWLLSYNDCDWVRTVYYNCEIIPAGWSYGMGSKPSNEVLIRQKGQWV